MPLALTIDRDPRFVGGAHPCDFPSPFVRLLSCLGIQVTICPPRRPDRKPFVERFNRTLEEEALQVARPTDLGAVRDLLARFQHEYNNERPNQAQSCQNRPPRLAKSSFRCHASCQLRWTLIAGSWWWMANAMCAKSGRMAWSRSTT